MPHTISGPRVISAPTSIVHLSRNIPPPAEDEVQMVVSSSSTADNDIHSQSRTVVVDIVIGSDIPQISPCTPDVSDKGPSMAKFLAEEGEADHGLHFSRVGFHVRRASWLPALVDRAGGGKEILRDIAGVVLPGESLALLGPSGAGLSPASCDDLNLNPDNKPQLLSPCREDHLASCAYQQDPRLRAAEWDGDPGPASALLGYAPEVLRLRRARGLQSPGAAHHPRGVSPR